MLSDKHINSISERTIFALCRDTNSKQGWATKSIMYTNKAIKEALELEEKSRWKYPEKGELPEVLEYYVIFYLKGGVTKPTVGMAYKDSGGLMMFFCNDTKRGYSQHTVKCWMYAPAQCEG